MKIFGSKTEALFDWWSLAHMAFYGLLAEIFLTDLSFTVAIVILISLGYIWEVIERALEEYDRRNKKVFFTEKEGWWNRYVGDMLANVTGFLLAWFY